MDYTQMLGNTNELKCLTAFIQLGFECSIPYGNGAKYYFISIITIKETMKDNLKKSVLMAMAGMIAAGGAIEAAEPVASETDVRGIIKNYS